MIYLIIAGGFLNISTFTVTKGFAPAKFSLYLTYMIYLESSFEMYFY